MMEAINEQQRTIDSTTDATAQEINNVEKSNENSKNVSEIDANGEVQAATDGEETATNTSASSAVVHKEAHKRADIVEDVAEDETSAWISQQNHDNLSKIENEALQKASSQHSKVDDADEDELLKSDDDEAMPIEQQNAANEDISMEQENELLKSDDDDESAEKPEKVDVSKQIDENEPPACNSNNTESKVPEIKDVVTISDEDSTNSLERQGPKQPEEQVASTTQNNEVINIDDESHDGVKAIGADDKQDMEVEEVEQPEEEALAESPIAKREVESPVLVESKYAFDGDNGSEQSLKIPSNDVEDSSNSFASFDDDSHPESAAKSAPITELLSVENGEQESNQTPPDDSPPEVMSDDSNSVQSIPERFKSPQIVKINGDHNSEPEEQETALQVNDQRPMETEHSKEAVIESEQVPGDDDVAEFSAADDTSTFEEFEDSGSNSRAVEAEESQGLPEAAAGSTSFEQPAEGVTRMSVEDDDDGSRCSSLVSTVSDSTTSSSHQLVIDQPLEDLEAQAQAAAKPVEPFSLPHSETAEEQRVGLPLKLTLKRKLSNSSDGRNSPQHKFPHLELNENSRENETPTPPKISLHEFDISKPTDLSMAPVQIEQELNDEHHQQRESEAPLNLSLMQPVNEPLNLADRPVPSPPEGSSSVSQAPSPIAPPSTFSPILPASLTTNSTKYLCFKCKTGSFDSFAALSEHQRICLINTSLLPAGILPEFPIASAAILPPPPPPPTLQPSQELPPPSDVNAEALEKALDALPVSPVGETAQKRRLYKCSSCNTFHENWNFFLHMREKHNRLMCLYCVRFFPTAEKLSLHLEIKHDLEQNHFNSEEALRQTAPLHEGFVCESRLLLCCNCQHVFGESDAFSDHNCTEYIKACTLCGQKGRHTNQCKAHPDAKRSSKVKKKAKEKAALEAKSMQSSQSSQNPSAPTTHCDNVNRSHTLPPPPALHSDDSNSSSNMIIDESCTTNHGHSLINPFKELDERERREQQDADIVLPPDRVADGLLPKLIVPKLKLRVPKEFQKRVDAEISSSESEEDEEEDERVEDADNESSTKTVGDESNIEQLPTTLATAMVKAQSLDMDTNSATESATELVHLQEDGDSRSNMPHTDDDSLEARNTNLARILQEIERTKMDIQRTKETLHHMPKPSTATGDAIKIEEPSMAAQEESTRNWTPTPPTSPKARWSQPTQLEGDADDQSQQAQHQLDHASVMQQLQQAVRTYSVGSDGMDIDETIGCEQAAQIAGIDSDKLTALTGLFALKDSLDFANSSFGNITLNARAEPMNIDASESPRAAANTAETEATILNENQQKISPEHGSVEAPADEDVDVCNRSTESAVSATPAPPADGIEMANEDTQVVDLQLDRPLEKFATVEFVRICLKAVYPLCLYCNHARRIAVNGKSLVLHMIAQHRFAATVDSITAEELQPETIVTKLKTFLPEMENEYFNSNSYCTLGEGAFTRHFNERIFECFQCRFVTSTHKELYLHNRKMHLKTAILCFMCRANFFSFSEILCHICPGEPHKVSVFDVKFRCCLCDLDNIPSPFRLMVHLRKRHFACDVCLEDCRDQSRLSSHVWKHKLHHLCYRCGIAYRNKMDITKHLFWKHGTESIICKRCMQKRWRHVYHFCVPPINFVCDVCNLCFTKAVYLKVHKRLHSGDLRYPCTEEHCEEKFISRRLLLKHTAGHQPLEPAKDEDSENKAGTANEAEEVKPDLVEVKKEVDVDVARLETDEVKKEESVPKAEENKKVPEDRASALVSPKVEMKSGENANKQDETPRKKRKKNKRSKESLEDLNLMAPNLSESDSSDESDAESKSRDDEPLVPNVMLSPPSEAENDKEDDKKSQGSEDKGAASTTDDPSACNVLDIWKNLLQAQQASGTGMQGQPEVPEYTEEKYPTPGKLHVSISDHDYCVMRRPPTPPPVVKRKPHSSPMKRKTGKSPRRVSTRHSDASSSSSESSSSSDSSCSCGSNCSCSSSGSASSSSSSSSDDSDNSSAGSNASPTKRHRKKSERGNMRKKSESVSPLKKHSLSEMVNVVDADDDQQLNAQHVREPSPPREPLFYESDLETAESETDEEFYDEHPQKLANELLAQKRAQLMAQTRLSPSHNYDIVENSRPSTPSLPEDVACETTKKKKKKRDRKSSARNSTGVPPLKLNMGKMPSADSNANAIEQQPQVAAAAVYNMPTGQVPPYDLMQPSPSMGELPAAQQPPVPVPAYAATLLPGGEQQLTPRPILMHQPGGGGGRMSEGSSCSDADGSLKRSKRARRPNKFYGYTSDDENMAGVLGQPLIIGMRAIKPQPPPQLTWRKEDLPTPSRSILNNSKNKAPRVPKPPATPGLAAGNSLDATPSSSTKKKRPQLSLFGEKSARKRPAKKPSAHGSKLPPIPTLKIRPSQIGINAGGADNHHIPSQLYPSSKETDDDSSDASSDEGPAQLLHAPNPQQQRFNAAASASHSGHWNAAQQMAANAPAAAVQMKNNAAPSSSSVFQAAQVLPSLPPSLPTPQTTAFNHKIPPALLPNPDMATLHYFKANNIRYPIRPPAGARQPREGESVYCYCRCPYDEVSEMIACDGEKCLIEWFHFECVGIMVAPQGKWFCAECRPRYSEELYPAGTI